MTRWIVRDGGLRRRASLCPAAPLRGWFYPHYDKTPCAILGERLKVDHKHNASDEDAKPGNTLICAAGGDPWLLAYKAVRKYMRCLLTGRLDVSPCPDGTYEDDSHDFNTLQWFDGYVCEILKRITKVKMIRDQKERSKSLIRPPEPLMWQRGCNKTGITCDADYWPYVNVQCAAPNNRSNLVQLHC